MISVREGIGNRVMGDYMAYWHEVYTFSSRFSNQACFLPSLENLSAAGGGEGGRGTEKDIRAREN